MLSPPAAVHRHVMHARAITLRELTFVRDVLIPRAWVQGAEVDELLRLRTRIDGIFSALQEPPALLDAEPTQDPPVEPASTERKKKPRHPKKGRGSRPHPDGS